MKNRVALVFLLLVGLLGSGTVGAEPPPYDIESVRRELEQIFLRESQAVDEAVRAGRMSAAEGQQRIRKLNDRRFAAARSRAPAYEAKFKDLVAEAKRIRERSAQAYTARTGRSDPGWREPGNTGTPLSDPKSRGIFGDQDLTFHSDADRAAFVQAAKKKGYRVKGKLGQGYVMIEDLDIAAHGPTHRPQNPLDPPARLQTAQHVHGHETFATPGSRQAWLPRERNRWSKRDVLGQVADNVKKVEHDLRLTPSDLDDWYKVETWAQSLSKGTGRAMDAAGKSEKALQTAIQAAERRGLPAAQIQSLREDLAFRRQLAQLKSRMDPRAAGLVPAGATRAEANQILQRFQDRALSKFSEAYHVGLKRNRALIEEMNLQLRQLQSKGRTAEARALLLERARILDADAQAIQYLATHPKDKGRLLAEIVSGGRLKPVRTLRGIRYRTPGGKLLTPSEAEAIARRALGQARNEFRTGSKGTTPPTGSMSHAERGMVYAAAVMAGLEGARKELEAAKAEGRDPSKVLATLRGWWEFTGIPGSYNMAIEISRDQIQRELAYIQEQVDKGEDPSDIYVSLSHAFNSLRRIAGQMTGISNMWDATDEMIKLVTANLHEAPGDIDALVTARADKMLALIERELEALAPDQDRVARLVAEAKDPMRRMDEAARRLETIKRRLASQRRDLTIISDRCRDARTLRQRADEDLQSFPVLLADARDEVRAFEVAVESYCGLIDRTIRGEIEGDHRTLGAAHGHALEALRDAVEAVRSARDLGEDLHDTGAQLNEALRKLTELMAATNPRALLDAAPLVLEEGRRAGREAAEPLEKAIRKRHEIEKRLGRMTQYIALLEHAEAAPERTRSAHARVDALIDTLIDAAPEVHGRRVNRVVEEAYALFEGLDRGDLAARQRAWEEACPDPARGWDASVLTGGMRLLTELTQQIAALRQRLQACHARIRGAVRPRAVYVSVGAAGETRIRAVARGQRAVVQTLFDVEAIAQAADATVHVTITLSDGRVLRPPSSPDTIVPGRPIYRVPVHFDLPADAPKGTAKVASEVRLSGRTTPVGETTFEVIDVPVQLGDLVVSAVSNGSEPWRRFARGDTAHAVVFVTRGGGEQAVHVEATWTVTYPGGRTKVIEDEPVEFAAEAAPGTRRAFHVGLATNATVPRGRYGLEMVARLGDREIARRRGTFEIVPLYTEGHVRTLGVQDDPTVVTRYRPGDPITIAVDVKNHSADVTRQSRVQLQIRGPDPAIQILDSDDQVTMPRGAYRGLRPGRIPEVIREGTYTVTATIDGGHGETVTLRTTFQVRWPVQFVRILTRDGREPPSLKNRFASGDGYEWWVEYRFVDVRPGDRFDARFVGGRGESQIPGLSSREASPGVPDSDQVHWTQLRGVIPGEIPSGPYQIRAVVRYNGAPYTSVPANIRIGAEPTIHITSPRSGFDVDKKVLVVKGTCADRTLTQATMITNGQSVPIKLKDGAFEAKTVLRPGRNVIRVSARNRSGEAHDEIRGVARIKAAVLKIVLSWEAPKTDIDLWVTDPEGKVTNYHKKSPAKGRKLDVDDTSGPGMETYTIEVPIRGTYKIEVHYFSDHGYRGAVPFTLQVTRWEATPQETRNSGRGTLTKAARDRPEPGAVWTGQVTL